jgi:hypothetical protein
MDILESLEVRWFLDERDPAYAPIDAWFAAAEAEGERTDDYLYTGRRDLGFKSRKAKGAAVKVETKYLLGSLGAVELAPKVSGCLERWKKLSLSLDDAKLQQQGEWLSLKKERRLRKYAFENGQAREVKISERPAAGCGVELTILSFERGGRAQKTATLGLEAFGPEVELLPAFFSVSRGVFGELGVELPAVRSDSYPGWMMSFG